MKRHLAIFSQNAIEAIFSGKKKVEVRLSIKNIPPFGRIGVGDLVYIKPPGKEIAGQFKVTKVHSFQGLDKEDWKMIRSKYESIVSLGSKKATSAFFDGHQAAKYGTLVFFRAVERFITSPIKIKKTDLRGWVVLD